MKEKFRIITKLNKVLEFSSFDEMFTFYKKNGGKMYTRQAHCVFHK